MHYARLMTTVGCSLALLLGLFVLLAHSPAQARNAITMERQVKTSVVSSGTILYSRQPTTTQPYGTIWFATMDGLSVTQVTTGTWPRVSPDGRYVVFLRDDFRTSPLYPVRGDVYVLDLQTGLEMRIFQNNDYVENFGWTPDSAQIFMDYMCGIYRVNRDSTNPQTLFTANCFDDAPAVNPLSGTFAFHNEYLGIGLANMNGSDRHFITNTTVGSFWPAWSSDGQWLSYGVFPGPLGVGSGFTMTAYYKIQPDGMNRTRLISTTLSGDEVRPAGPWTSDGQWIIAPGTISGTHGVYAIATDGSGRLARLDVPADTQPYVDFVGAVSGTFKLMYYVYLPLIGK